MNFGDATLIVFGVYDFFVVVWLAALGMGGI